MADDDYNPAGRQRVGDPDLDQTLERVAELTSVARDPWWIFGGAAAALYGDEDVEAHDVDVLMSPDDAKRVLSSQGITHMGDGGTDRFRSAVYGQVNGAALPIDVLAGFEIMQAGVWVPVAFSEPVRMDLSAGPVYVPRLDELIAVFRLCGRRKDLDRADRLEALR